MASIYQSIEILSKEKGIDPQIVLDAVKDAMLAAARKHFRSKEDLIADLDRETGNIQIYSVKKVVEAVEDPIKQITLDGGAQDRSRRRGRRRNPRDETDRCAGPHFGPDRQAGDSPEGARGRARERLFGISGPPGRAGELRHQAPGRPGLHRRHGQNRGAPRQEGAVAPRKLQRRRSRALRDQRRGAGRQELRRAWCRAPRRNW